MRDVDRTLKSLGISQLPVVEGGKLRGHRARGRPAPAPGLGQRHARFDRSPSLIESDYATVTPDTKIELLQGVLSDAKHRHRARSRKTCVGIVTKIDLIEYLANRAGGASQTLPPPRRS